MSVASGSRESWLFEAKLAYLAERYDEAVDDLSSMAGVPPTEGASKDAAAEARLVQNALEYGMRKLRTSIRGASSLADVSRRPGLDSTVIATAQEYIERFRTELSEMCQKGISICTAQLGTDTVANKVSLTMIYNKLLGDCYRYLEDGPQAVKHYKAVLAAFDNGDDAPDTTSLALASYLGIALVHMEVEGNRASALQTLQEATRSVKVPTGDHKASVYMLRINQNIAEWTEIDNDAADDIELTFPDRETQLAA